MTETYATAEDKQEIFPRVAAGPRPKKAEPRRNHYLAQGVLLKHFQRPDKPGQVYRYARQTEQIVSVGIHNVGCERDLYTLTDQQGEPDYRVETELFGTLDSGLAPLFARLNAPLAPFLLKPRLLFVQAELVDLATYVAYQMQRTPAAIHQLEDASHAMIKKGLRMTTAMDENFIQTMRELIKKHPELQVEEVSDEQIESVRQTFLKEDYDLETGDKFSLGMALEMAQQLIPVCLMKALEIWKAPPGKSFLTSDWPILKITNRNDPPIFRGGLISSHITPVRFVSPR